MDDSWREDLKKEIKEKFNALKKMPLEDTIACVVSRVSQTPFVYHIASAPKPSRFSVPTFKMFDGSADPKSTSTSTSRR